MRYGILALLPCAALMVQAPATGAQSPASTSVIPLASSSAGTNTADLYLATLTASRNYQCHVLVRAERNGAAVASYELHLRCHGRDMLLSFIKPRHMVERKVMKKGSHLWLFARSQHKRPILISPSLFGDKLHVGPLFDMIGIDWQNYRLTSLPPQVVNGKPCFVVAAKALNQSVYMDAITIWLDQKTQHPVKSDFYDEDRKTFYHCQLEDMPVSAIADPLLYPRRFTVTTDGDDTRYVYEVTDLQKDTGDINWDDLYFNQ